MKLAVYVQGRDVAILDQVGDFKSVLTYHAGVSPDDLVSLTMPVRTESYVWDDQLPPVLQMNLPEGYLLQVLQEQFGPHVGASPLALLAVVGRNMVGRVQVAAPGAMLDEPAKAIEVAALLKGDNSEAAFAQLVRQHAASGVSGVIPKFLDAADEPTATMAISGKASLITHRHIVKGSSKQFPFIALNEFLCMQVAARILPAARTEVSDDGQVLVVHRFDVDGQGQIHWGMEDLCSLLGLRPAAKYDTTWERIARAMRHHIPGSQRLETFRQLTAVLLLTYALRNADCHAKNLALLYTSRADAHLSPVYDMLTTSVYEGFQHNPPAIEFMGEKTWTPGKNLQRFIAATFGIGFKEQAQLVESISDAVADVGAQVRVAMALHPGFVDLGKRMLGAWAEGVDALRNKRVYDMGQWRRGEAFDGFAPPAKMKSPQAKVGRSPLLGRR